MSTETTKTEVTEFEDGSKIVTTEAVETEFVEGDNPPASVEVVEEVTDAAVEIAEIEAERDVAIAEIQAEVSTAAIEASEERQGEVWQNIEALQTAQLQMAETLGAVAEAVQSIQQQLTPPPSSQQNPPSESGDGLPVAEEAPAAAPEPPAKPKKSRWI